MTKYLMEILSEKKTMLNPKLLGLAAATSAVGFLLSWATLAFADAAGLGTALLFLGAGALFVALLAMQALVVESRNVLIPLLAVESLAAIALIASRASLAGIAIVVVAAIAFVAGGLRGQQDATTGVKVHLGKIVRAAAPLAVSAIALLFAYAYTAQIIGSDLMISRKGFDAFIASASAALRGVLPDFNLTMPVNKFIEAIVLSDLPTLPAELRAAPREAKLQLIAQSRGEFLRLASERLGVPVGGSEAVSDVLYRATVRATGQIPERWKGPAVAAFGALAFLTVRSFGFLFAYLASAFAWVILRLLLAGGFMKIELQSVSKEVVRV